MNPSGGKGTSGRKTRDPKTRVRVHKPKRQSGLGAGQQLLLLFLCCVCLVFFVFSALIIMKLETRQDSTFSEGVKLRMNRVSQSTLLRPIVSRFNFTGQSAEVAERSSHFRTSSFHDEQLPDPSASVAEDAEHAEQHAKEETLPKPLPKPQPVPIPASDPASGFNNPPTGGQSTDSTSGNNAGPGSSDGVGGGQGVHDHTRIFEKSTSEETSRKEAVKAAMLHAWRGYKGHCWGQDELKPVSGRCNNWLQQGGTIVDSLGTLHIMGLKDEFEEAAAWVRDNLNLNSNMMVSFFETIIRILGGLVSAYELTGRDEFLTKATDLGDRLLKAFNTPTGLPLSAISLGSGRATPAGWTGGNVILSEVGSIQLEFFSLSKDTGNPVYREKSDRVFDILRGLPRPLHGLYPLFINPNQARFTSGQISFGAMGDSFYEYMIKLWILTDKKIPKYKEMYEESMDGMFEKLVKYSDNSKFGYVAEYNGAPQPKMDHLACFIPGMLALGARHVAKGARDLKFAEEIMATCHQMYSQQKTGLAPEFIRFTPGGDFTAGAWHNLLRPETVESLMYLWRATHDQKYRDWGWEIFNAFESYTKVQYGYSGIKHVNTQDHGGFDDTMQTFFLAETLKYLYLLFSSDDVIPLDEWVFNTEAHPLRIHKDK